MKSILSLLILTTVLVSRPLFAGEQNITLSVDKMTCASCPYIVKKSLEKVSGVKNVSVSLDDKTASVTYNDETTTIDQLIAATTGQGYPSQVIE